MPSVFDDFVRTDAKPARHGEGRFEFLNRSATKYFGAVRDLIDEWYGYVPAEHKAGIRGNLRADDHHSASAFWELYLHEAYRRSGADIEIHPQVPSRSARPDFRITLANAAFYLEAVTVGRAPAEIAEDSRLDQVHRVLADMLIEDFSIELSTYGVGPRPLATKRLRGALRCWLDLLEADQVVAAVEASEYAGFDSLPELTWNDDGWSLVFHALPLGEWARGTPRSALGLLGPGEAVLVDNETGLRRVLASKKGKYGPLDAPLVIAVLSNTEYPTRDYEVENALYGVSSHRPIERAQGDGHLFEEGFWIGTNGWRNGDVPQVLAASDLYPWTITVTQPRCWYTLEPGVDLPTQPDWLAQMKVDAQAVPGDAAPIGTHFGLADDWPGMRDPDFDLS
jgi:hypothetical protein